MQQQELDWKVLTLHAPSSSSSEEEEKTLAHIELSRPGEIERVVSWFASYKVREGGLEGRVGLGGRVLGAGRAADVVATANEAYGRLRIEARLKEEEAKKRASIWAVTPEMWARTAEGN